MKIEPASEMFSPAVQALINARNRSRDHRHSEIESFTQYMQSHVGCIENYDREIADITAAIAQLCPQMSGEACAGQAINRAQTTLGGCQK